VRKVYIVELDSLYMTGDNVISSGALTIEMEGLEVTAEKIAWLAQHVNDNPDDKLEGEILAALKDKDALDDIYRSMREGQRKCADLVPGIRTGIPTVDYEGDPRDAFDLKKDDRFSSLYLDGARIVAFSETVSSHVGHKLILDDPDLEGYIYLSQFFQKTDVPKRLEGDSDARHVARTFFNIGEQPYVSIVQHLKPNSATSEHYHGTEEEIFQLAGISSVSMRDHDQDWEERVKVLYPGDRLVIPPRTIHQIFTGDEQSSLSVPVKMTTGKKDHFYKAKSDKRLEGEVLALCGEHYPSGQIFSETIVSYVNALDDKEKESFRRLLAEGAYVNNTERIKKSLN